jgi:hypothetical protein
MVQGKTFHFRIRLTNGSILNTSQWAFWPRPSAGTWKTACSATATGRWCLSERIGDPHSPGVFRPGYQVS